MSDWFGAANSLFGGVGSLLGGNAAASGSKKAAALYGRAADLTATATGLKETAASRQIYQTLGGGIADAAANGLNQSGSAEDILRSGAQQGALSKALIQIQGDIDVNSLNARKEDALASASAQSAGGIGGFLKGALGVAAALL